ncbi:UNVERIFIED_CONTAM: hypothetical protein K2H54_048887 [Gekko kuhli]
MIVVNTLGLCIIWNQALARVHTARSILQRFCQITTALLYGLPFESTVDEEDVLVGSKHSSEITSDPLPNEQVGDSAAVSQREDLWVYAEQMVRMAEALEIDISTTKQRPKDKILRNLYSDSPAHAISTLLLLAMVIYELYEETVCNGEYCLLTALVEGTNSLYCVPASSRKWIIACDHCSGSTQSQNTDIT